MSLFKRLFPYSLRTHQLDIMNSISNTLEGEGHLILESGTGTGKTICTLTPILSYALEHDKKVLYCTRTNSQQRQVIFELRAIKEKLEKTQDTNFTKRCLGIGLQGRQNLCLLTREDNELLGSTAEELSKLCSDRKNTILASKNGMQSKIPGCKYYKRMLEFELTPVKKWIRTDLPTTEDIMEYCVDNGICPYELCKSLLSECVIVAAPYIYIFNKFIRRRLMEWLRCNLGDLIIVIDEAHNLPDYARELGSMQLSSNTLHIAHEEAIEFGDPDVAKGLSSSYFINIVSDVLRDMKKEYVVDEDGLVPPEELQVELMTRLKVISNQLNVMVKNLLILGEIVRGKRRKKGRLPRSYLHGVGSFLEFWFEMDSDTHVKLIIGGDNPKFEMYCMDPSIVTDIVNTCAGSIHISGTLVPQEEFRDSIGLPKESKMEVYPSPFPPKNRRILFVDDVTTKFEVMKADEKVLINIEKYIETVCNNFERNTIVFFPSFKLLNQLLNRGIHFRLKRKFFFEQQNMGQRNLMELIEAFREERGVLFAVVGGRISEGMDFPGDELEIVVIVGIPYPRPTARQKALQNYYEKKFNKGWEYTVHAPTTRKLQQSIGRLIRNENDKGIALILDNRTITFKPHLKGLVQTIDVVSAIKQFF
jgi:DNA excision repair protein ERCC-2